MLWIFLAILLVLWLLGMISGIASGLIHLLLVVGAIALLVKVFSGRRGTVF